MNEFLIEIHELSEGNRLFPEHPDIRDDKIEALAIRMATLDPSCFYGSLAGFHYRGDSRRLGKWPKELSCAVSSELPFSSPATDHGPGGVLGRL